MLKYVCFGRLALAMHRFEVPIFVCFRFLGVFNNGELS